MVGAAGLAVGTAVGAGVAAGAQAASTAAASMSVIRVFIVYFLWLNWTNLIIYTNENRVWMY
jgi:hypothetical protein